MAIQLNEWKEKFPDVEEEDLLDWISDMTLRGIEPENYEEYLRQRSKGIYPTNEELNNPGEQQPAEEPTEEEDDDDDAEEQVAALEAAIEKGDVDPEDFKKEMERVEAEDFSAAVNNHEEKPRHSVDEPPVPFDNPDMSDIDVPEPELEDDEDDFEEEDLEPYEPPERPKADFRRDEMVTKTVTMADYEQLIQPFRPVLDDIKEDSTTLNKLAAGMDSRNLPPYMQIKSYILNHPIKDPTNTKVRVHMISESNPGMTEQNYVEINRAWDVTRELAAQRHYQEYIDNYDIILEKMMEERRALVSLIFILESYCEAKQASPFELSIPKQVLMDSVQSSFQNIQDLITQNVIKELSQLRGDLAGQLGDVSTLVAQNMGRFDTQIQEAVTKVMWKVKTDVESTNMEDIKKSILYLLNKRSASYNLGGGATAIMCIMLDDLERRLLETGFKFDQIGEHRKYTIQELTRKLGYKKATVLIRAIPQLIKRKLVRMYENKTISL
jgi:hypothetical protein